MVFPRTSVNPMQPICSHWASCSQMPHDGIGQGQMVMPVTGLTSIPLLPTLRWSQKACVPYWPWPMLMLTSFPHLKAVRQSKQVNDEHLLQFNLAPTFLLCHWHLIWTSCCGMLVLIPFIHSRFLLQQQAWRVLLAEPFWFLMVLTNVLLLVYYSLLSLIMLCYVNFQTSTEWV